MDITGLQCDVEQPRVNIFLHYLAWLSDRQLDLHSPNLTDDLNTMKMKKSTSALNVFISTFGRLPNTWLILVITVFSGFSEGIGLALFIPLIELLNGGDQEPTRLFTAVKEILNDAGFSLTLTPMLMLIILFGVGSALCGYLQRRLITDARYKMSRDIKSICFSNTMRASWSHLADLSIGEIVNDLTIQAEQASSALQLQVIVLAAVIQALVLAAINIALSWKLFLCIAFMGAFIAILSWTLVRRANRLGMINVENNRNFGFISTEYLQGRRLLKICGIELPAILKFNKSADNLYQSQRNLEFNTNRMSLLMQAGPIILIAVLIGVASEILHVQLPIILVFLLVLSRLLPRLSDIPMRLENFAGLVPALLALDKKTLEAKNQADNMHVNGKHIIGTTSPNYHKTITKHPQPTPKRSTITNTTKANHN